MLVVPLQCGTCGAHGRHLDGSLLALCGYCGAIIAQHREVIASSVDAVARAYRGFVAPDAADARKTQLDRVVASAIAAGDREQFRLAATELALLRAAEHPAELPLWAADVAAYIRHHVAARELATFESALAAQMPQAPLAALERDPAAAAPPLHAACCNFARAVLDHPAYPVELRARIAADAVAADTFRTLLAGAAPQLSADALVASLTAALGASTLAERRCPNCGGRSTATTECPWCRSAIDAEPHPWVAGLSRIASAPLAIEARPTQRAHIALGIVSANASFTGKRPHPALVLAYLRRTVPDLDRAALLATAALLALPIDLSDWEPTAPPYQPAAPPPAPTTLEAALADPWVTTQLATWHQIGAPSGGDAGLIAVTIALVPLGLGHSIAATQIAAFLMRTGVSRPAALAALELRRDASNAALLDAVIALLA